MQYVIVMSFASMLRVLHGNDFFIVIVIVEDGIRNRCRESACQIQFNTKVDAKLIVKICDMENTEIFKNYTYNPRNLQTTVVLRPWCLLMILLHKYGSLKAIYIGILKHWQIIIPENDTSIGLSSASLAKFILNVKIYNEVAQ